MVKARKIVQCIRCPLDNEYIEVENCKACPYHEGVDSWRKEVECSYLTQTEAKMLPEPVKQVEFTTQW